MTERRLVLAALGTALVFFFPEREASSASRKRALTDVMEVRPGATCVEAGALAQDVRAWLGAESVDAGVWVRVEGSPDDPHTVSFEMGRGEQVLARRRFAPGPERCEHLQAALGLAIALAIRVSLLDEIVGPPQPAEAPVRQTRELWALGGGAIAAFGVLPGAALGASVRVERELPPNFTLRLGLMGLAVWDRTFATVSGSYDAEIVALRADGCVRLGLAPWLAAQGCAGILAGGLLAQGRDFPSSRSASSAWIAAADAIGMTFGLTDRWSLDGEATLVLPFERLQIGVHSTTGDVVEARDLSSVGVTMMLGIAYRF